ncbi:hypothetical protein O3P69_004453 [Scylla paramamosain]|uniref:Uncharacterized protein n=1 Tax=Scylla paramamosain TaxID=85552 RepID=A0AAW0UEF8_SCYPA
MQGAPMTSPPIIPETSHRMQDVAETLEGPCTPASRLTRPVHVTPVRAEETRRPADLLTVVLHMLLTLLARRLRDYGTLERREKTEKKQNCSDRFPVREKPKEYQNSKNAQKLNAERRQARQVEQAP